MSGFADLLGAIANRLGQQVQATQQGVLGRETDPNAGGIHYGALPGWLGVPLRVPATMLQGAGLVQEAGDKVATTGGGELALLAALAQAGMAGHLGVDPNSATTQTAQQMLAQGFAHPGRALDVAQHGQDSATSLLAGALHLASNPLNYVGGIGELGTGLRATERPAMQALGAALQGVARVGEYGNAPPSALFAGIGALPQGLRASGRAVGDHLGVTSALDALRGAVGTAGDYFHPPAVAPPPPDVTLPALAALRRTLPGVAPELTPREMLRQAQTPDDFLSALRGNGAGRQGLNALRATNGTDEFLAALNQQQRIGPPAAPAQSLDSLAAHMQGLAARPEMPAPTPLNALEDFAQGNSATYRTPTPTGAVDAPTGIPAPAAADLTDRTGTIKGVANGPLSTLNAVLADLHNALYPGQSADFAIPALTGQSKSAFRTSFLTDHPQGNAAEPYLDYLINRAQKDPQAAARLASANPGLADELAQLAQNPMQPTEHKALIQALFDTGAAAPAAGRDIAANIPALTAADAQPAFDALLASGDSGHMQGELPAGTAFWERRLGIAAPDAQALLDGAVADGRLKVGPDGALRFRPGIANAPPNQAPGAIPTPVSNVDIPAAVPEQVPGVLSAPPTNNYRVPLSRYTDRLYRESDINEALAVIDPGSNGAGGPRDLYFSNTPDLALGQGANRGVLIEYAPHAIEGTINTSKPAWPVAWQGGAAEFVDRLGNPNSLTDSVRSVTVPATLVGDKPYRIRFARTLTYLEGQGWTKATLPDGSTRYTPPGIAPGAPNQAPSAIPATPRVTAAQAQDELFGGPATPRTGKGLLPKGGDIAAGVGNGVPMPPPPPPPALKYQFATADEAQQAIADPVRAQRLLDAIGNHNDLQEFGALSPDMRAVKFIPKAMQRPIPANTQEVNFASGVERLKRGTPYTLADLAEEARYAARGWTRSIAPDGLVVYTRPLGGDIAAGGGGGGMGITPNGLPSALSTRLLLGGGAGGAAGALGGALAPSSSPDDRLNHIVAGGLGGAAAGAGLAGGLGSPSVQAIGKEMAIRTQLAGSGGGKLSVDDLTGIIRTFKKTSLMVPARNAIGASGNVVMAGGDLGQAVQYARSVWDALPHLLPELRAAGDDPAARAVAMYKALPAEMQTFDEGGIAALMDAIGAAYERNIADQGAIGKLGHFGAGAAGVAASLANPRALVTGLATPVLGLAEGLTIHARDAAQRALTTVIDVGARTALSFPVYKQALADAAPGFIAKMQAVDPTIASSLDAQGRFGVTGMQPAFAAEWTAIQHAAAEQAGKVATDAMGDFSNPSTATKWFNTLFPGGSWNVQQAAVLARAASRHPAIALAGLGALMDDYKHHLANGDPQNTGTWTITDKTPGWGLIAKAAAGGLAPGVFNGGVAHINPVYPFSPFGGETLDLPRQLGILPGHLAPNPNQNATDMGVEVANALGLADNPIGQAAAYKFGAVDTPPSAPLRLAGVGQYLDAKLNAASQQHGGPALLKANDLAALMAPMASPVDKTTINQQLRMGTYQDPAIAKAGAEIIYELTGRPASDPANAPLLAELRDHQSALYQQALDRGLGGKAVQGALSETSPMPVRAESQTATNVGRAQQQMLNQGLPFSKAQLLALASGDRVTASMALTEALNQARKDNPILRVNDAATPETQATALLDQWKRVNAGMQSIPALYQYELAHQAERLGLVPLGTAAATVTAYNEIQQGLRPGLLPLFPGGPLPQGPNPGNLYNLQDYINHLGR